MSDERKYRYTVALEWSGTVEVEPEDGDDEDSLREVALDFAIDEALSSPAGYVVSDYTIEPV